MSIPDEQTPNWQPISFLPNIAWMIDGMLASAQEVPDSIGLRGAIVTPSRDA